MRTFLSKVGGWYWVIIVLVSCLLFWSFWIHLLLATLLFAIVLIILIEALIHTQYIIMDDGRLCIEGGRFFKKDFSVDVMQIVRVERSASWESSPALSLHRLKIIYRNGKGKTAYVLVSPKNEDMFVRALLKRNNSIIAQI